MGLISSKTLTNSAFALPYLINADNKNIEYSKYINAVPTKTDKKNEPTKLEFSMVPFDSKFVKLVRGNYIVFQTQKYGPWFTGFIINDPELTIIGSFKGQAVYGYSYTAMSDEYLVNLKPMGIVAPFFNMTQGAILKALAEDLCPGMYDFTGITDGLLLPRYQVNPTDKFTDIVKAFCDASQNVFFSKAGVLYFAPATNQPFAVRIDGSDKNFTPSNLTLSPTTDPIINDATILGDIEPQNDVTEYFAGDGFSGSFSLINSPFGVDSTIILQDDFSGGSIDSSIWTLYDEESAFMTVSDGYLNVLGGLGNDSYGVHLDSACPIPVEGHLRLTHGQWDFINEGQEGQLGIICALWTNEPRGDFSGCFYGLEVSNVSGVKYIKPIVNGVLDTTQSIIVDTTNRYVIRTVISCDEQFRTSAAGTYRDQSGTIITLNSALQPATYTFNTTLTTVDINTGLVLVQNTFTNTLEATSDDINYALYIPLASNDLHASFNDVTISYPIQGKLNVFPPPPAVTGPLGLLTDTVFTTRWPKVYSPVLKTLGQNELDSLDGDAPDATIADSTTGITARSSLLGTPQYNTASAALTFFKDSVALVSTTPDQGSLIQLKYKAAGTSTGRVINEASINSEAAVWKDDGVRAIVKTDASPKPRTSRECQIAAGTLVGDNCFQHYEGSYSFNSQFLTYNYEPISGGNMYFVKLPSQFPNVLSEEVTQVETTLDSRRPIERFTHTVTFGPIDRVARLLDKYSKPTDVFTPDDSVEAPTTVGLNQAGLVFVDNITNAVFYGMDPNYYYYTINEAPPIDGGFEIRLSDSGWGSNDGNNLVVRLPYNAGTYPFQVSRSTRSKVVYAKKFDGRNKVKYSEDLTKWTSVNCTVVNKILVDPSDNYSFISTITSNTPANYFIESTLAYSFGGDSFPEGNTDTTISADVKAASGTQFYLMLKDLAGTPYIVSQTFTGTGSWQRVSFTVPNVARTATRYVVVGSQNTGTSASTLQVTRISVEENSSETGYFATNGKPYGAESAYSAAVRVNFPFIPPQPATVSIAVDGNLDNINTIITGSGATATTSYIQQVDATGTPTENNPTLTNPQVTITLPDIQLDIFGVEIRAADDTTVLYRQNLSAAGYSIAVSLGNTFAGRTATYFVRTYNVFGEYCTPVMSTSTVAEPLVTNIVVDDTTRYLSWNGIAANSYTVTISDDSAGAVNPVVFTVPTTYDTTAYDANSILLQNSLFEPLKYITIFGTDSLGDGPAVQITHEIPSGTPGFVYRPNAHGDSSNPYLGTPDEQSTGHKGVVTIYSMESSYDTDSTTYGIIQISSGTFSDASSTGGSIISGFSGGTTTTGQSIYVNIALSISTPTGGSGNPSSFGIELVDSTGTIAVPVFGSNINTWSNGTQFTVSAAVPAGVDMSTFSVILSGVANVAYSSFYSKYVSISVSASVYDVYIQ